MAAYAGYIAIAAAVAALYEANRANRNMAAFSFQQAQALGVDLDTSNYGQPIAVIYGTNKVGGECIWYGDFVTTQVSGGKGGSGPTSYNYSASYMFALCEGPITGFGNVWEGSSFEPLSALSPAFTTLGTFPQTAWSHFSGTQALGYNGFALIAFLNYNLGGSATTPNYQFEVGGLNQFGGGVVDALPSAILTDICTNAYHGIGFPYLGSLTQWQNYCQANGLFMSPVYATESAASAVILDLLKWTNSAGYFSEGVFKIVPYGDTTVTGNGATFTPNNTPIWNFTNADYVQDGPEVPPVQLERRALTDTSNTVRLQYTDRSYYYYDEMVEARDENDAITNGVRAMTSQRCDAIVTASVARFVAQNMLQRSLYIRNRYKWQTSWRFAYLEPMDIVTLTDTTLGLNQAYVRITSCEEQEDGSINFEAEEFPIGVGHSAAYNTGTNGGFQINTKVDPGPVAPPAIFRMPGFLTNSEPTAIGIGLAGTTANYGGAQVYMSYDNTNFFYVGTWNSQARYGLLGTGGLPTGSDPDTVNTPTVALEQGQLIGGTAAENNALQMLSIVDSELISYKTATLVSGTTYTLGTLRRGAYNTGIATHSAGATFVRLDNAIMQIPVDPSYVGQTIYFKFLAFNCFGKTPRTLASETSYSYVVGSNANIPDTPPVPSGFTALGVADGISLTWSNTNPAAVACTSIERAQGWSPGTTFATNALIYDATSNTTQQVTAGGGGLSSFVNTIPSFSATVGNTTTDGALTWTCRAVGVGTGNVNPFTAGFYQCGPTQTAQPDHFTTGLTYYYRAMARGILPQAGWSAYTAIVSSVGRFGVSSTGGCTNLAPLEWSLFNINNILPPSGFTRPVISWSGQQIGQYRYLRLTTQSGSPTPRLLMDMRTIQDAANSYAPWNIPVAGKYIFSVYLSPATTVDMTQLSLQWLNGAGTGIGVSPSLVPCGGQALGVSGRYSCICDFTSAGAGNYYPRLAGGTGDAGSLICDIEMVMLEPQLGDCTTPSPYVAPPLSSLAVSGATQGTTGSTPANIANMTFGYSNNLAGRITWSWSSFSLLRPDGSSVSIGTGSLATTGLSNTTTYKVYPFYDEIAQVMNFVGVDAGDPTGSGSTLIMFPSTGSIPAANYMSLLGRCPLSASGMTCVTSGAGGGGGGGSGGGGNSCLHPRTRIKTRNRGWVPAAQLQPGLDYVLTSNGWQPIKTMWREPGPGTWVRFLVRGAVEPITVTPDEPIYLPDGTWIRASSLKLRQAIAGSDQEMFVRAVCEVEDNEQRVCLDVGGDHKFYVWPGGPEIKNTTYKP